MLTKAHLQPTASRGMALIFVLTSLLIISAVATEIAYSSHVSYHLATYRRDEVQAQWLLRSSLAFGRLLLKYDKELRQQFASLGSLPGMTANAPFCTQVPFSTTLLRGVFNVGAEDEAAPSEDQPLAIAGILASQEAEDFLSFQGDFGLECVDEQAKFNINYFYEAPLPTDPASTAYDDHKSLLASLLAGSGFKDLFAEPRDAQILAGHLADWVDKDENINDYGGAIRGYESSSYPADTGTRVKNGKFSSLEELHLVAGMTDDIYERLVPQVTLYGDNKVNICLASPEIISGLVVEFSKTSGRTAPVAPDNKEFLDKVVEEVQKECEGPNPNAGQVGRKVEELLGATNAPAAPAVTPTRGGSLPRARFESLITTQNRFLSLKLTANVGETELTGEAVLDTQGTPSQWKTLYYRVY